MHVARRQPIAVGPDNRIGPSTATFFPFQVVAPLNAAMVSGPRERSSRARMPSIVTTGHVARWLHRAVGDDLELLPPCCPRRYSAPLDPHPLLRLVDLVLVEDEADVAALVERRDAPA